MNNQSKKETSTTSEVNTSFVNDECGDTMWDDVLKSVEDKAKEL